MLWTIQYVIHLAATINKCRKKKTKKTESHTRTHQGAGQVNSHTHSLLVPEYHKKQLRHASAYKMEKENILWGQQADVKPDIYGLP